MQLRDEAQEEAAAPEQVDFELSDFGGVQTTTASNGSRVRQPIAPQQPDSPQADGRRWNLSEIAGSRREAGLGAESEPASGHATNIAALVEEEQAECRPDPDLIAGTSCYDRERNAQRSEAAALAAASNVRRTPLGEVERESSCRETETAFETSYDCSGSITVGNSPEGRETVRRAVDEMLDDDD